MAIGWFVAGVGAFFRFRGEQKRHKELVELFEKKERTTADQEEEDLLISLQSNEDWMKELSLNKSVAKEI